MDNIRNKYLGILLTAVMTLSLFAWPSAGFVFAEDAEANENNVVAAEAQEVQSGNETQEVQSGNETQEVQGGNEAQEVQGGNEPQEVQGGNEAQEVQGGNEAQEVQGGNEAQEVQGGNEAQEVQGGNEAQEVQGGNEAQEVKGSNEVEEPQTKQVVSISRNLMSSAKGANPVQVSGAPVIKVGNIVYASIDEAAAANPTGGNIEISSGEVSFDSDLSAVEYTLSVGKDATLLVGAGAALKGESGKSSLIVVKSGGKIVVNGGSFINSKKISPNSTVAALKVESGAEAEFHGGTFAAPDYAVDVYGTVTKIDGGRFMSTDNNQTGSAIGMRVYGKSSEIGEISGGEFSGFNTSGGGTGLYLMAGAHVGKITGGTYYGGTRADIWSEDNPTGVSGSGLRIGGSPYTDTSSVDDLSGGIFRGGRCLEVQTKTPIRISGGTVEGLMKDGSPVSSQGVHVDYTSNAVIEGLTIKNVQTGIANYGTISKIDGVNISGVNTGIVNQSAIGTISNSSIDANECGIGILPYSRSATPNKTSIEELKDNTIRCKNGITIEMETYLDEHENTIGKISGGTYSCENGTVIKLYSGSTIGEISGGTFSTDESDSSTGVIYNKGTIDNIKDGTFTSKDNYYTIYNTYGGKIGEISGGTFSSDYAACIIYNTGRSSIDRISGGTFTSPRTSYILYNTGNIDGISGGEYSGGSSNVFMNSGTVGEISGGSFSSTPAEHILLNKGKIGGISGGSFNGGYAALNNIGSIEQITGGSFTADSNKGWFGIYNIKDGDKIGEIGMIDIAEDTGSVFKGRYGAIGSYNGATLGDISGYGTFLGGIWGTLYGGGTICMEMGGQDALDLTKTGANPGNGRYADNSKILGGSAKWKIPEGYHMSNTKLAIPVMDDADIDDTLFAFIAKDNTIIYSGNGHELEKGTAAKGFRDTGLMFRDYSSAAASVEDNDPEGAFFFSTGNREFLGWNTKADGSGTQFAPGDVIDFSGEAFANGSDILLYAQWGEELEPAPGTGSVEPDPEVPDVKDPAPEVKDPEPAAETTAPAAAAETAEPAEAVTPAPAAAEEVAAATAAAAARTEVIRDNAVPLSAPETAETPDAVNPKMSRSQDKSGWALINLLAAIVTVAGAAITFFRARRKEEKDSDRSFIMNMTSLAAAAASAATFFITEDMTGNMVLADRWTAVMLILLAVQAVSSVLASPGKNNEEIDG